MQKSAGVYEGGSTHKKTGSGWTRSSVAWTLPLGYVDLARDSGLLAKRKHKIVAANGYRKFLCHSFTSGTVTEDGEYW